MKHFKNIFLALLAALFLFACEEDEKLIFDIDAAEAPALQTPASGALDFTKDDATSTITFSWSEANMGVNVEINYILQFSTDNFQTVSEDVIITQNTTYDVKVSTINNVLLTMEIAPGTDTTIQCRVAAKINDHVDPVYSSVSEYTATPYETLIDYPMIYVPGAYQGWSPGAEDGRLYSYNFDNVYEGIIRISGIDGNFKITPEANWDNAWGGSITATSTGYTGTLDPSGGNFEVTTETAYQFTVDVDALTLVMEKTDDWGIIGSAVAPYDWSVDVNLNYNGQRKVWEITTDLKAGELKFRANNAWTLNYGLDDDGNFAIGGNKNIPIAADGTYLIRLDLENMTYLIEIAE